MPRLSPASSVSVRFAALVSLVLAQAASAAVRYVDAAAPPGGDGLSWQTAYNAIPPFLFPFGVGDEYRIAQGVYKPAAPGGARAATFTFPCTGGVVKGGYAGFHASGGTGTPDPDEREPVLYPTILSGDLNGDDLPAFANRADNSWHVVTIGVGLGPLSTVDGFTITGGFANGGGVSDNNGGGVFGDPVILKRCMVTDNHASFGGGAYIGHAGGNIPTGGSRFEDCWFTGNRASGHPSSTGAGVYYLANPATAPLTATFLRCVFADNTAAHQAGGAFVDRAQATFYNCLFHHNTTNTGDGAAIALGEGQHKIVNCTVADNTCNAGFGFGAIGAAALLPGAQRTVAVTNSIVWGNAPAGIGFQLFTVTASYSDIQSNLFGGVGNIDADPLHRVPGVDYALTPGSPCADAGNTAFTMTLAAAFGMSSDLARAPRFYDDPSAPDTGTGGPPVIDMGCFETGPAPAIDPCPVDTNADGVIDFFDLNSILTLYGEPCP